MKLLVLDLDESLFFASEQSLDRAPDFEWIATWFTNVRDWKRFSCR